MHAKVPGTSPHHGRQVLVILTTQITSTRMAGGVAAFSISLPQTYGLGGPLLLPGTPWDHLLHHQHFPSQLLPSG